jgi:tetratricopeptide (TPR) repeat protein
MIAIYGSLSIAQDTIAQDTTELSSLPDSSLQQQDSETASITWPLLSGESVESLARAFYPKNKKMQRLFVSKTLQLSREIHPTLNAATISNQASLIVIPNLKLLSKLGGGTRPTSAKKINNSEQANLRMSYKLKDAAEFVPGPFVPSPEAQAHYENLVKTNASLKLELDNINEKLAHLQQVMVLLSAETERVLSLPAPAVIAESKPAINQINPPERFDSIKNKVAVPPASTAKQASLIPMYMWLAVVSLLLAFGAFLGFRFYRRRHSGRLDLAENNSLKSEVKSLSTNTADLTYQSALSADNVDLSITSSEYSGSISDLNLDAVMNLSDKEESERLLEQARIYVSINREREAIMLLKSQIQAAPKASLHHWLYLLDIYRGTNQKEEFLKYAGKLHENYNVMTPQWDNKPLQMDVSTSLEEFPYIVENLTLLWGSCEKVAGKFAETKAYLETLITDNRNNERIGFSLEVLKEIMLLRDVLDTRAKLANID